MRGLVLLALFIAIPIRAAEPVPLDAALRDRCVKVLRDGLKSDEFWPAMHAAEALTLAGHGREVLESLAKRTETDDQKRCGLAREAVRAGDRTKLAILFAILDKPGSNGHTHAAESLFKMADIGDGTKLRAALAQNENVKLKLMAAAALARCGHPTALESVRAKLADHDRENRKIAAWILGQLGEKADAKGIASAFESESDPLAKAYAVNALALLGDADARKQLIANLSSTEAAVKTYAAEFAGYCRLDESRVALVRLLDDPTLDVRVRAAQSLIVLSLPAYALGLPFAAVEPISVSPTDWPWWRGPTRDGVAPTNQVPPVKWSETENILWKAPVPGRGHGSAIVVGDRVYLAAADPATQTQSLLAFDRKTGKPAWTTVVHKGAFETKGNAKSSFASSTPACDGKRVYINFLHAGAIHTTALDLNGNRIWQTKVTDYVLHQGFASSPAIHKSLVLVSADNKGGGVIAGLDRATGDIVWTVPRPKLPNYASPIVLTANDREQLVLTGCDLVTALDPLTGKRIWETKGSTTECVTSTVTDGRNVFTSGGYPKNHVAAVAADGSGRVVWENTSRVYVPSLLRKDAHLYGIMDDGFAVCWRCDTGKEVWKERLGGTFSSSPVLVGEAIVATNESGRTFVFAASPGGYAPLGENRLGDSVFATPTICGSRIYLRAASTVDGKRIESLYCIGRPE
jgi:outer membrane protein assembly factor BamB